MSTLLQSPTIGTSTLMFFEIDDGSTSMWMISALGAKASTRPVTRSSKRAPIATRQSEWCTAMFA